MEQKNKEFSFDEFIKSDLYKKTKYCFFSDSNNIKSNNPKFKTVKLNKDEINFAINSVAKKFK